MDDLIRRSEVIDIVHKEIERTSSWVEHDTQINIEFAVMELPTVCDVDKIIRCKDCDVPHNKWTGCSKLNGLVTPPDFYCAFGRPKITEDIL